MKNYHATLMVVDDDPNDLFLIERAFRAIGVTGPIHTINGGLEAIAYMKGEGKYSDRTAYTYPTFITTDLKMPQRTALPCWSISGTIQSGRSFPPLC
jgi:CheY-like chemotaxis protein